MVQQTMNEWRYEGDRGGDKDQAAEKRIGRGKKFSRHGLQLADRPHPTENHGGVQNGVHPWNIFQEMIAQYTHPKATITITAAM